MFHWDTKCFDSLPTDQLTLIIDQSVCDFLADPEQTDWGLCRWRQTYFSYPWDCERPVSTSLLLLQALNPLIHENNTQCCDVPREIRCEFKCVATNKNSNLLKANKAAAALVCSASTSISVEKHFHSSTRNNSWFAAYQEEATKTEQLSALPSIRKSAVELTRWRSARLISRQQKLKITARKRGSRFTDAQRATTFNLPRKHSNPSTIEAESNGVLLDEVSCLQHWASTCCHSNFLSGDFSN